MTPSQAVSAVLSGVVITCTPDEYPVIRAALQEAQRLLPNDHLGSAALWRDDFTMALNRLAREHQP